MAEAAEATRSAPYDRSTIDFSMTALPAPTGWSLGF
jgi:hypothetical protein